ncbi:MAG: tRNA 2-selenouridine(34) synthase MnmH [Arenicella sp.]|nr:tRNA 2-selenouridine(34) synthase MnmH [Arenicella sp.]
MTETDKQMSNSYSDKNLESDGFLDLFVRGAPLMDVRAPVEFNAGAFPGASNRPLLDDEQRHLVGTEYAQRGQQAAIDLGLHLASPEIRAQRLDSWIEFVRANPDGYLYCFRGGLRSKTTQKWLAQAGWEYPLIQGGYKAMRRFLLRQLDRLCERGNIILLAGATGVGKTELIGNQSSAIDLEGRANHRGSAFGKMFAGQPSQINWENHIIVDWLKCEAASDAPVLIEAESHLIGRIHLPQTLQQAMARAPVVLLEADLQQRSERLYRDYVMYRLRHFQATSEETLKNPWDALQANVLDNLTRIKKRLGGLCYQQLCGILPQAVRQLREHNDATEFKRIIELLMENYYDRLNRQHMDNYRTRIVFRGSMSEISNWLNHNTAVTGDALQSATAKAE